MKIYNIAWYFYYMNRLGSINFNTITKQTQFQDRKNDIEFAKSIK